MKRTKVKLLILFTLIFLSIFFALQMPLWALTETPAKVYTGIPNAREILKNINFRDIASRPASYWAKDAIYETAALEAIKGYGDSNFRPGATLSKEEAISLIYRMLGREADAQKAAETLDASRSSNQKKTNTLNFWADGYLQLAANDGLITQANLQTALQRFQPKSGTRNKFLRSDPAQRQEVAAWVVKALKLSPAYGQENIFNSFKDWSKSDPTKVPYIEAALENKIMNGKTNGYFEPLGKVKREEMARILKNMEPIVLAARKYEKKNGYIEAIHLDSNEKLGGGTTSKRIDVRGDDGKLYNIIAQTSKDKVNIKGQEFSPGKKTTDELELVVYRNGKLSTSDALKANDQIDYIADPNNQVKFVNVRTPASSAKTIKGIVAGVDPTNNTISIKSSNNGVKTYTLSGNAEITDRGNEVSLTDIKQDNTVMLNTENDIVVKIQTVQNQTQQQQAASVSGIVEDNNPQLRYISLYDEGGARNANLLRIYNYKPELIQVLKNQKEASINDIQPGDSVYIKRDTNNEIVLISGADNYDSAYGKVVSKQKATLGVQYDDGTQQVLGLAKDAIVISNKKTVTMDDVHEGDYIRLILQKTPELTVIKEITLQTYAQNIDNIYKAELADIDTLRQKVRLKHPERLKNGSFERISDVGFLDMESDDDIRIFDGQNSISPEKASKLLIGKQIYVAARKNFGDQEIAQMITLQDDSAKENNYDDKVFSVASGAGSLKLNSSSNEIGFGEDTIVVEDGRLISGKSLAANDKVYLVSNKNTDSGIENAKIIAVPDKQDENTVQIFRGKIGNIKRNKDFTLDTYSILNDLTWEYNNSPKTFDITYNTRIFNSSGVDNVRDFVYTSSWSGKAVYVVADETEALLVSDASYGAFNAKGEVYDTGTNSPSSISIMNATVYNADTGKWELKGTMNLALSSNTIIIKDNKIAAVTDIEDGDLVRILKKEDTTSGNAYLVFIEK